MSWISIFILVASWIFVIFGMLAIFLLKNLYTRILSASTIDTVASLLVLFALIFARFQFDSIVRLVLLILFLLITSPISSHVNIRSAYLIGIPIDHKDGREL